MCCLHYSKEILLQDLETTKTVLLLIFFVNIIVDEMLESETFSNSN